MAALSRTHAPPLAREMLSLFQMDVDGERIMVIEFFEDTQIYQGSKMTHFKKVKDATGIEYRDMLFFDDEARNKEVEKLGVVMQLVRDGMSWKEFNEGVRNWRRINL